MPPPSTTTPPTTSRCCGWAASSRRSPFAPDVRSGTPGAVLGYPENGPLTITPARLGATGPVITQDSYGRGPVTRS